MLPGARPASAAAALLLQQHDPWQGAFAAVEGQPPGRSGRCAALAVVCWTTVVHAHALLPGLGEDLKFQIQLSHVQAQLLIQDKLHCQQDPLTLNSAPLPPTPTHHTHVQARLLFQYKPYCQQGPSI